MIQQINLHERMGPDRDRTRDPSVPQWLSGISRNDWRSPVNSFPAADRCPMKSSNESRFGAEITDAQIQYWKNQSRNGLVIEVMMGILS